VKKEFKILGIPVYSVEEKSAPPDNSVEKRNDVSDVEKRNADADISPIRNPKEWLLEVLGQKSSAGAQVNENTALNFSAVWSCVRILSETLAVVPIHLYRIQSDGKYIAVNHPVHRLIHSEPNQIMASFAWRETMMAHCALWGNGYSIIHRDQYFQPAELELVPHPTNVTPFIYKNRLYYQIHGYNMPFPSDDIFHFYGLGFTGVEGKSVLSVAREAIGSGLAMQEFGNRFFGNGSNMDGLLKTAAALKPDVRDRISKDWDAKYSGLSKSHKTVILEGGLEYQRIGIPPEDSQFLQSRLFSIEEIARFYRMQLHKLQHLEHATYSNIEHQAIEFVTDTMMPWYVRFEYECNRKLLSTKEKSEYFTKFNTNGLLRGDAQSRAILYRIMSDLGIYSVNEIRELEEKNSIEGGDKHLVQLNRTDLKNIGEIPKN